MEEYRLDIKVRNNIILRKIEQAGYKTLGELCRANDMMGYVGRIGKIINMKLSPFNSKGEFVPYLEKFCNILGCAPYDLFTDTQLNTILETNKRSIQVNEAEMRFMIENNLNTKLLEEMIEDDQKSHKIEEALNALTPKERTVIEMRLGLGEYNREHNLEEIANKFDVTRERVRQIEHKAYRKMRYPRVIESLREFVEP